MVRQSSHLARIPLEEPNFAAAHAKSPAIHLMLPKEHATLLVPDGVGVPEPHVPSMRALQQVTKAVWDSLATCTRDHTSLAGASEFLPVDTVHHGPTPQDMLRARDGRLPTMQACDGGGTKSPAW